MMVPFEFALIILNLFKGMLMSIPNIFPSGKSSTRIGKCGVLSHMTSQHWAISSRILIPPSPGEIWQKELPLSSMGVSK